MALSLVTGPTSEPISLTEAKAQCRVDTADDDAYLGGLITTARRLVEEMTSSALITQTWEVTMDEWPTGDTLTLPLPPLQAVSSIKYVSDAGGTATFGAENYLVDTASRPGRVRLKKTSVWPSVTLQEIAGVQVRFVAGYGTAAANVEAPLRHAMLLLIEHWYENREPVITTGAFPQNIPMTVATLVANFRYGGRF